MDLQMKKAAQPEPGCAAFLCLICFMLQCAVLLLKPAPHRIAGAS